MPDITHSNAWRYYPRAEGHVAQGIDAAYQMRGLVLDYAKASRERQLELRKSTGFAGDRADVGHAVSWELHRRGMSDRAARLGGHLVATADEWNFQGTRRLAFWAERCQRTMQRARLELEQAGLITSRLLLPGDQVRGQRGPVHKPQVVRDVRALLALIGERVNARRGTVPAGRRRVRKSPSDRTPAAPSQTRRPRGNVAHVPTDPLEEAAVLEQEASRTTDSAVALLLRQLAAAKREGAKLRRPQPQPEPLPPFTDEELDAFDAETDRLRAEEERRREQRGPPN